MRNAAGVPQGTIKAKILQLGAGGYITAGIQFANDGTAVCGGDTFGAWVKGPTATRWTCLFESGRLPSADISANNYPTYVDEGEGCYGITIAPTDSSRIYMTYNGFVEKSTNGGQTFTRMGGPYVMKAFSYNGARWSSRRMVCDPRNANVMMLGPQEGKIVYTTDGSTLNVLTVAAGTADSGGAAAQHFVAVDPSSAVAPVGGVSQKWAYSVQGTGICESTTGPGGTYSLLSGSPATPRCVIYDAAGNLWALAAGESTNGNVYKKTPAGSFTKITAKDGSEFTTIAVDPNNTNHVMLATENGEVAVSLDGCATFLGGDVWNGNWPPTYGLSLSNTSIKWMGRTRGTKTGAVAEVTFRPTDSKVFVANGIGIFNATLPSSFSELTYVEDSLGIEEMEVQHVMVPSGGYPIVSVRDRGMFPIIDETGPKNQNKFGNPAIGFGHGWFVDDVPGSPGTLISACGYLNNGSGKSTDYGLTWTGFPTIHPDGNVMGGSMVAVSSSIYLWFPSNNARPARSTDGGNTWAYETIGNTPTSGEKGWGYSLWAPQQIVAVDKTNGDCYAWNYGDSINGASAAWAGLWKRDHTAGTWSKVFAGVPTGANFGSVVSKLKTVPGQTGHICFKGDSGGMARSTDGGTTFAAVGSFTQVSDFSFGKAATGKTYPAAYVMGTKSGVYGLYRSDDFDQATPTWTFCGSNLANQIGGVNFIAAHPDIYGKLYIGFAHHAGVICEYSCALTVS